MDSMFFMLNYRVSKFLINLSNYKLNKHEISVLDKGLTFVPSPSTYSLLDLESNSNNLIRRVKLVDYFGTQSDNYDPTLFKNRFNSPSYWTPIVCSVHSMNTVTDIQSTTNEIISKTTDGHQNLFLHNKNNISHDEKNAIHSLKHNTDIVIKSADKGGAVVVMDKYLYIAEAYRQLNNTKYYSRITKSVSGNNAVEISGLINNLYDNGHISQRQKVFFMPAAEPKPRQFYLLPKVHKPTHKWPNIKMPEGRPIVSCCGSELHGIGKLIDYYLQPFCTLNPSYIKDTYHFISKIRNQVIQPNYLLVTADVSSLYTNMDKDIILSVIKQFFTSFPDSNRPDKQLLELLELSLCGNDFMFNEEYFLQILGMAMGNPCAPSCANLFLEKLDKSCMSYFIAVLLFSRFLDDIFFVWTDTKERLLTFQDYVNNLIPNIKVTFTISEQSVNFLDLTVFKHMDEGICTLQTKPYFKETDTHQLLHTTSYHPKHIFKSVVKSQFIRLKRLSSFKNHYDDAVHTLCKVLLTRGYSKRYLRHCQHHIWYNYTHKPPTQSQNLPIVVKYNSIGLHCAHEWRKILQKNPIFHNIRLITAFSIHKNLGSILTSSKLLQIRTQNAPAPINFRGCEQCSSTRCKACNYITTNNQTRSYQTGRFFQINSHITCKSESLVYVITCKKCHLQYVGETGRSLGERICDHLSCIRLNKCTPIGLHFNTPLHNISHFSIIGIELTNPNDITYRKKRESFWQRVLQTIFPKALNNLNTHNIDIDPVLI